MLKFVLNLSNDKMDSNSFSTDDMSDGEYLMDLDSDESIEVEPDLHLRNLPDELSLKIFDYLNDLDKNRMLSINHNLNSLFLDELFWKKKIIDVYGENIVRKKPFELSFREQYVDLMRLNIDDAIRLKRLDLFIHFFLQIIDEETQSKIIGDVAEVGWILALEFAYQQGIDLNEATGGAAMGNQIDVLNWLNLRGFNPTVDSMTLAVDEGNIKAVDWLVHHGVVVVDDHYRSAIYNSQIHVLNYFAKNQIGPSQELVNEFYQIALWNQDYIILVNWFYFNFGMRPGQ
jgi:hypothetical protein